MIKGGVNIRIVVGYFVFVMMVINVDSDYVVFFKI